MAYFKNPQKAIVSSLLMRTTRALKKAVGLIRNYALFSLILHDYIRFKQVLRDRNNRFTMNWRDFSSHIGDKTKTTGFDRHYLYHVAWAARKVKEINPALHVDVASSLYFCSLVSSFIPVKFYDYRPPKLELPNLTIHKGDLLKLPFKDGEIKSLSCMHTVEHIGLGRYGDPINPDGDLEAIKELKRVLALGGSLLFVVPVGGRAKIMFNAHRIYSFAMIKDYFSDMKLKEFALIPEKEGAMILNASPERVSQESYGCGCFWFVK